MPGAETFRASAEAYDRHVGRYGPQLAEALIGFAGVEPGMRALDVGCGPGALTAALAGRLGARGVAAVDPSEPFVQACRARQPQGKVGVAAAETLPFADATFDAVLSQLVVNFMHDAVAGVREMVRVTRPGGVVASCVWDYAGEMTLLRAFWDSARDVDPARAAAADEGAVMRWCGEGELAQLWSAAGLRDVRAGPLVVSATYGDFEDLWAPLPTGVAPSGAFCASLDEDRRAALHDAYRDRLGVGDGPFELTARAWAAAGTTSDESRGQRVLGTGGLESGRDPLKALREDLSRRRERETQVTGGARAEERA
jgi:SAM-dependent methyltransferase